ncbi:MAG: hypothetical protein JXA72_14195, partial [Bacteroidales bacterium]|nr:hypothetical protein [Bacteroidales bacterium]
MNALYRMVWLFWVIASQGYALAQESFPVIDTTDLPGARFDVPKTYSGASLFGYMNGGAELYREYGCKGAWIGELAFQGGTFKIEIFKMTGPEEAFGIYSVSRYQCKSNPPLSPFTCHTPYQLQLCKGPYYINIINATGNKSDSVAALQIGKAIAGRITEASAEISAYLPGFPVELVNREAILVKGELGLMNSAPDLAAFFNEAKGYCSVILQRTDNTLISVKFASEADKNGFLERHQS